jgi:hypothetical protein
MIHQRFVVRNGEIQMNNYFIAFVMVLFLVEQSATFASSFTPTPKTQPPVPVLFLDTGGCTAFIQNCTDTCSALNKIETGGCAALGAGAAAFISIPVGGVLTFYCQAKVEIATARCNATCSPPTQFQCEN